MADMAAVNSANGYVGQDADAIVVGFRCLNASTARLTYMFGLLLVFCLVSRFDMCFYQSLFPNGQYYSVCVERVGTNANTAAPKNTPASSCHRDSSGTVVGC